MVNFNKEKSSGFTLIEMIVSLGVFSVVVTTAVGAMLMLIATNQRLQGEQSVMTNLAFALDAMTREMRTGYGYYCDSKSNYSAGGSNNIFEGSNGHESVISNSVQDCSAGRFPLSRQLQGVSFFEGGDSITKSVAGATRILYFYDSTAQKLYRRVGNNPPQTIVSDGLVITDAQFYVTGSANLFSATNVEQPTITIYLEAKEKNDPTSKVYYLETTVTQRILDL